ncbi:ABC transporter substrate-binding protein [Paenibacillus phoenicis]|jgi:NitT/TauT family transport system substrate-binding protein|uniref:ABC transporter substrate-binding protein n=1 Tax=Paenibacillus phoenicis TaxID=554117 RepID=A0ABU5PRF3_9BACL|nr:MULTISPECIES: ABC transporter substrate-binding protein [Paenibacillus]MCT2197166.1 ABC transporter substrate-binding protein [Paenibacillus sp. p3-SID1389]MEA3572481.1 ABC transporter substrate-binding protein [Paenibacillus phoenicis]
MYLKKTIHLLIAVILVLSLAACGSSNESKAGNSTNTGTANNAEAASAEPAETAEPSESTVDIAAGIPPWQGRDNKEVTLTVGFSKGMTGIANQFAVAKGWYEDAGIHLNFVDTPNPVSAFGAGEVDLADGDPGTYIPAIVNGVKIKVVSNMWRNRGAYWIIAKPEIKSFADLKGKTVGSAQAIGGMALTLMEVLSQNGIDPKKDVELVPNGFYQSAYATFVSGEVDATIIHNPYATMVEKNGEGNVLAKTWEYLPDYHTGVLVASQKLIDEQPDVVERVLEVYFYANEYAKTHFDEFIPWAAEYLNLDEETTREAIEAEIELWENNPIVDVDRLQVTEDLLTEYGMQRDKVSVDGTVDNQFAEKVAKTLKLDKYKTEN